MTKNVIPAHRRLPVSKKTAMAASAAIGKAKRKPMNTIATKPIINRIINNHQKPGSERFRTCSANKKRSPLF